MNIEKLKENIKAKLDDVDNKSRYDNGDNYNTGQYDALQWVLDQFPEENELLKNSC